jgi:hypothetical protein
MMPLAPEVGVEPDAVADVQPFRLSSGVKISFKFVLHFLAVLLIKLRRPVLCEVVWGLAENLN